MTVVAKVESVPAELVAATEHTNPVFGLLQMAIEKNIPVEALEKLQALYEKALDRQAASEFAAAVAEFQRTCPPIHKNALTDYTTKSGMRVKYAYAELPEITKTIAPHLQKNGLAYTWDSRVEGSMVTVVCILRHTNGHKERAQFTCPAESNAGMSEQQKYAAALSFGRRQTLIQVLGLTTSELEKEAADPTPISEEQATELEQFCDDAPAVSKKRFLKWVGAETFAGIPAAKYEAALQEIKAAKQRAGGAA